MNTKINAQFIVDNARPGEDTPFVYKLPKRATSGSAGYDFFANCNFEIPAHGSVLIDTGQDGTGMVFDGCSSVWTRV